MAGEARRNHRQHHVGPDQECDSNSEQERGDSRPWSSTFPVLFAKKIDWKPRRASGLSSFLKSSMNWDALSPECHVPTRSDFENDGLGWRYDSAVGKLGWRLK
jgi:hypothetical protein